MTDLAHLSNLPTPHICLFPPLHIFFSYLYLFTFFYDTLSLIRAISVPMGLKLSIITWWAQQ